MVATDAFVSLGTTSPRNIRQHAMMSSSHAVNSRGLITCLHARKLWSQRGRIEKHCIVFQRRLHGGNAQRISRTQQDNTHSLRGMCLQLFRAAIDGTDGLSLSATCREGEVKAELKQTPKISRQHERSSTERRLKQEPTCRAKHAAQHVNAHYNTTMPQTEVDRLRDRLIESSVQEAAL